MFFLLFSFEISFLPTTPITASCARRSSDVRSCRDLSLIKGRRSDGTLNWKVQLSKADTEKAPLHPLDKKICAIYSLVSAGRGGEVRSLASAKPWRDSITSLDFRIMFEPRRLQAFLK